MYQHTLMELSRLLHAGRISSTELTGYFLARSEKLNPELNAYITLTKEPALRQAELADKKLADKSAGPLTGIPVAHKDIFCTDGVKTSCGSKMLDNFIAPYNATVMEKCNRAGMVMLGKTNMDEFAMGSSNENSYYGPVKNPWHKAHVPGGSSGGSGSVVAARMAAAATGTDTGGSIRQPAALCGVTGLKPTYGRVSRYGMIAFASSLDQGGPITQTAEDAAWLLSVMAGYDARDSTSVDTPVEDYPASLNDTIAGVTIGLPRQYFDEQLNHGIAEKIQDAIRQLEQAGAVIREIDLPNTSLAIPAYYVIAPAEASSNLSRYDGVRFGHRCAAPKDMLDLYCRSRDEGFGAEVKRRIMIGTYVLSAGYYDAYYLKAQKIRRLIRDDFQNVFRDVDVIISPTSPTTAFKLNERTHDPVSMYLSDAYTVSVNLAGLPAISVPAGFSRQLPIGMQIIGNYFTEAKILNVAHQYQLMTDWHKQIPQEYK